MSIILNWVSCIIKEIVLDNAILNHGEEEVKKACISRDKIQDYITKKRRAVSNSKDLPEINQQNKNEYDFPLRLDNDIMVLDREFSCVTHENDFLLFMNSKNYDCSNAKFINLDATYLFGRQARLQ